MQGPRWEEGARAGAWGVEGGAYSRQEEALCSCPALGSEMGKGMGTFGWMKGVMIIMMV